MSALPSGASERNEYPMADGLLYYFPAALAAVARVSKIGNDQHNPGEPMHWARNKSTDHANKIIRHQLDAGTLDSDGTRHSAKVAWRALAQLQEELEREDGAPLPRNARPDQPTRLNDPIQPVAKTEKQFYDELEKSAMAQCRMQVKREMAARTAKQVYDDQTARALAQDRVSYWANFEPSCDAAMHYWLQAEALQNFGIGDVTRRPVMAAEADRISTPDDKL